jgi:dihydrofolate synthase/folylpolyglutamate synthase
MTTIDEIMARLLVLHPKRIDLSLGRLQRLLTALGNPERAIPPVIHVAGTNGKGSAVAFMRAMLEAAGKSVHVYTSPHLVRVNERFRLGATGGGVLVSDAELTAVLAECERRNGDAPITVFEIETAAAFVLFARHPADVTVLEVGLGGRLDATNVIDKPIATVITPVSIDHVDFLGDTLEKIAIEKSAIMKPGVPAVIGRQVEGPLAVITQRARDIGAPLNVMGQEWMVHEERGRLVYQDERGLLDLPPPRLFGQHQFDNAGTAIAALRAAADLNPPAAAFEQGIVRVDWPARMQRLSSGVLTTLLPEGGELWLDGGHNADGGRAAAAALADIEERVTRPLIVIAGMLSTKDPHAFLSNFGGLARRLIAVPVDQDNGLPAEAIAAVARAINIPADPCTSIEEALALTRQYGLVPPPRILITGSLYLAGDVLALNGTPPN